MPLLYPTSCKCSTESFVNSASPFPLLFFFDFLFFLESKGSKRKSIAGKLFFCAFGGLANVQRKTDGSHTSRPFFCFKLDVRENAFCPKCTPQPLCLLFLFFKKRNRSPSFLFRRKEAKENHLRNSYLPVLLPLSPTCRTKRTVHIRTVRFFVPSRTCGKASFLRLIIYPAVSFVSFLQEKKSFPFFSF